eukprot:6048991-Lingulodinium_polyedra.AAC.1
MTFVEPEETTAAVISMRQATNSHVPQSAQQHRHVQRQQNDCRARNLVWRGSPLGRGRPIGPGGPSWPRSDYQSHWSAGNVPSLQALGREDCTKKCRHFL